MINSNDTSSKKILFVDDELQILKSLNRLFRDTEYEIFTAESGKTALEILAAEKIDMIITDMKMPEMDGCQLLEQVKKLYPNSLRIILSGYTEKNTILEALKNNTAKLYILKPWENDKLVLLVNQLFETENLLRDSELLSLINRIDELPTLKNSYRQIMDLVDQDADLADIAAAIEKDPSIATKILRIINSAFYEVKTGSIKHAITYLGLSNVKHILLPTAIIDSFNMSGIYGTRLELLWNHSFLCNKFVTIIYQKLLRKKLSEYELSAGLLHNIGIVLLLKLYPEKYIEIFYKIEQTKKSSLEVEQDILHVTHQQTGGYLLRWWELPHPIIESALYHHTPFANGIINRELIYAVNIAQHYASLILKNQLLDTFDPIVFHALGIQEKDFEKEISFFHQNPTTSS